MLFDSVHRYQVLLLRTRADWVNKDPPESVCKVFQLSCLHRVPIVSGHVVLPQWMLKKKTPSLKPEYMYIFFFLIDIPVGSLRL